MRSATAAKRFRPVIGPPSWSYTRSPATRFVAPARQNPDRSGAAQERGPRRSSATDGCSARRNAVARAQRRKSMRRRGGPPPGPLSTLLRSALHTRRPQDAHAARCVEHGHVRCHHSVAHIRGVRHRDGGHRQAVRSRRCFARRIDDTLPARGSGMSRERSARPRLCERRHDEPLLACPGRSARRRGVFAPPGMRVLCRPRLSRPARHQSLSEHVRGLRAVVGILLEARKNDGVQTRRNRAVGASGRCCRRRL